MRRAVLVSLLSLVTGPAFGQAQVNVYNWSDYIAEDQLKVFAKETGIKVNYTTYDSNEILDAKLKTGRSGYDVVVPTASPFFVRQLAAKLYQPLDRAKLKHWGDLDPTIMTSLAGGDICLAFGFSGDIFQARDRAAKATEKRDIAYAIPNQGAMLWIDVAAIPRDAPHPDAANRFIDFMLEPAVAAASSNLT